MSPRPHAHALRRQSIVPTRRVQSDSERQKQVTCPSFNKINQQPLPYKGTWIHQGASSRAVSAQATTVITSEPPRAPHPSTQQTLLNPEGLHYFNSSREMSVLSHPICGTVNKIPHYNFTVITPALVPLLLKAGLELHLASAQRPARPCLCGRPAQEQGRHKALGSSSARVKVPARH